MKRILFLLMLVPTIAFSAEGKKAEMEGPSDKWKTVCPLPWTTWEKLYRGTPVSAYGALESIAVAFMGAKTKDQKLQCFDASIDILNWDWSHADCLDSHVENMRRRSVFIDHLLDFARCRDHSYDEVKSLIAVIVKLTRTAPSAKRIDFDDVLKDSSMGMAYLKGFHYTGEELDRALKGYSMMYGLTF